MGRLKKTLELQDIAISELVYTVARDAPISAKRLLPERYFRVTQSGKWARSFATQSSFNQKLEFLSYFGINWFIVLANVDKIWGHAFNQMIEKSGEKETIAESIKEGSKARIIVTSDKHLIQQFSAISNGMNTQVYSQHMELVRSNYSLKKWDKKLTAPVIDTIKEDNEACDEIIESFLIMHNEASISHSYIHLPVPQLKILCFYFLKKNRYVTTDEMRLYFRGFMSRPEISGAERRLRESQLIQISAIGKKREYTITARGVLVISQFLERLSKVSMR